MYFKNKMGKEEWIDEVNNFPTIAFGLMSIWGNAYVILSIARFKIDLRFEHGKAAIVTHDFIISHLIAIMASVDSVYIISLVVTFCVNWQSNNFACTLSGFTQQFLAVFTALWRLLIPGYLFYLLKTDGKHQRKSYDTTEKTIARTENMFSSIVLTVILLSFIASTLPLIWNNKNYYGVLYNYTHGGYEYMSECWVESYFEYIYYILVVLSVLIDTTVLFIAIWKYNQTKWYTSAYVALIKRLSAWVGIFLVIRMIPFVDRLLVWIFNTNTKDDYSYSAPLWFIYLHHYVAVSLGSANALVWYFTRRIKPQSNEPLLDQDDIDSSMTNVELQTVTNSDMDP